MKVTLMSLLLLLLLAITNVMAWDNGVGETREMPDDENEIYKCGEFEVFHDCGSECPEACYNMGRPRACGNTCKIGCFCREGLFRDPDGNCVRPFECPSSQLSPQPHVENN